MRKLLLVTSLPFLLLSVACQSDTSLNPNDNNPDDGTDDEDPDPQVEGEPVADAGPDQENAQPLQTVLLSGIESYDPNGSPIEEYRWEIVSVPDGSTSQLMNANTVAPSFFVDFAGEYVFSLSVRNAEGVWDSTPDTVKVTAIPLDGFYVQVSWDTLTDIDLHLLENNSPMWSDPGDCSYCNMNPEWGSTASSVDNPSLDWDIVSTGYGPETTTIDSPASGTYRVQIHYYSGGGEWEESVGTNAKVTIYMGGQLAGEYEGYLDTSGDVWDVATISWPSRQVTDHDQMTSTSRSYCD